MTNEEITEILIEYYTPTNEELEEVLKDSPLIKKGVVY